MKNKIFQKISISKIINQYQIHSSTIIIKPHSKSHLWANYYVFNVTIPLDVGLSTSYTCKEEVEFFKSYLHPFWCYFILFICKILKKCEKEWGRVPFYPLYHACTQ
jgi:hypothetical protein